MKILVAGANGQLGSEIRFLSTPFDAEFVFAGSGQLDVTNFASVEDVIGNGGFDYVINCSAYTAVDLAESELVKAEEINVFGVKNLAMSCKKYGSTLIHVSTDFVFDGKKNTPYNEVDVTNPTGVYGLTKLKGEQIVQEICENFFIIRTSWLYSSFGNNFVKTMLSLSETRTELGVIVDQVGTPTYARDLAKLILKIIKDGNCKYGIYHFSNSGVASWFDFAKAIFENKKISIQVNPISTSEYPTPAERPKYSVLSKEKVKNELNFSVAYWRDSLSEMIKLI